MEMSILTKQRQLFRKPADSSINLGEIEVATLLAPTAVFLDFLEKNQMPYKIINFNMIPCCVMHQGLKFYDQPKQAQSPGSKALYVARSENKYDGLLLQYLPPDSITSKHYHGNRIETYYNLEGRCLLNIDGKDFMLEKSIITIKPRQVHQVRTGKEPSLTLLDMSGGSCLSMEDHIYV